MKKRIAFFLGSMGTGGAERVISILSNDYAKRGWTVDICVLLKNEVAYSLDDRIKIWDMSGDESLSRIQKAPYWLKKIREYVRSKNPDTVVSFAARINVLVLMSCYGLNTKIVVSERNDPKFDGRGFFTRTLTKVLYPHAYCVVFQTKRVQSYFCKKIQSKSCIIPNPIEVKTSSFNPVQTKIVTVGSLKEQKNHKMLINAFNMVLQTHPNMELYIYGEGSYRKATENCIDELGLSSKVHLMGNSTNVHEEIMDSVLFVLSSDYEGLSNALLEAMVMGLPCISTNCAGSDEYIIDGNNGILVPVGDELCMTQAINTMLDNKKLRNSCAENAKKIVDIVGKEAVLDKWRQVIE